MIQFPEVLDKDELEELDMMTQPIEKFFTEDCESTSFYDFEI